MRTYGAFKLHTFCTCGRYIYWPSLPCSYCGRSPFVGHPSATIRAVYEKSKWWKPRKVIGYETPTRKTGGYPQFGPPYKTPEIVEESPLYPTMFEAWKAINVRG